MSFSQGFSQAFAQSLHYAQQEAERKRQEEQNKAIAQMYLESMRAPADAAVAPYQQNAIQSQDDAFRKQMVAESSAMTDSLMANNPNFTQRIQGQTAPVTPEQAPALQQQFQQTNQANLSQANNQAQSAEQMLAMAKEKYGTAMFDRLAPIVASGKVPAQAMISIIERQVQTAEKTALKQAQNNAYKQAMELMKQGKVDEAKMLIAEYASPDAQGRLFASIGQNNNKLSIAPDGRVVDMRTGLPVQNTPTYSKPEKPEKPAAGTWLLQTNPDGSQSRINSVTGQVINVTPPKETIVPTPFGPMKNTDLLAKIEALRPKEIVTTDDFGNKVTKKDGNVELYNQLNEALKAWQAKQNPTTPTAGNFDPNNLTPEQFEEAKKLKELGLSREQIMQELQFRKSGAKSR